MLSDYELIIHKFPDRPDIKIYPIGDIHLGAAEHMSEEWIAFCKRLANEENAYCILLGDLINNCTRSSVSDIWTETMRPSDQKKLMVKMLRPIKDKILCAVSGNHEIRSRRDADDNPAYDIMCKLDIENLYRENAAFLKIQMGEQDGNGAQNPTYVFAVMHGSGGGALSGGAINRNERFGYALDGIDGLIVGHSHKPIISQPTKIFVDSRNNKVTTKPFKVVSCSSWLNWGGYAARKMLTPTSHAPQIIKLCGRKKELRVEM